MRRTFTFLSLILAGCLTGQVTYGQTKSSRDGQELSSVAEEVEPVGYQTYLGDGSAPAAAKSTSASARFSAGSVSPTSYATGSGCSCGAGCAAPSACTARGCSAPAGCAAPSCGAPGCASKSCADMIEPDCASCPTIGNRFTNRVFGTAEYLFWWSQGRHMPALATTAPVGVVPDLGNAATTVLFGGDTVGGNVQSGGRLTAGLWMDDAENTAIVARTYSYNGDNARFAADGTQFPVLGHPFFNTDPTVVGGPAEFALLVNFPGGLAPVTGNMDITAANKVFGIEAYMRSLLDGDEEYRIDVISGFQYNRIDDDLLIKTNATQGATTFGFTDLFDCENDFFAGTFGLQGELTRGIVTWNSLLKVAAGNLHQQVRITGTNTVTAGGAVVQSNGGIYAQPQANIGNHTRDVFTFAPEAGLNASIAITQRFDVTVGYTFMYWNRMALAGDHVDRNINASQMAGNPFVGPPAQPGFRFSNDGFWAQTLSVGANFRY